MFDFTFAESYGDPQEVRVLAKRDLNGDGTADAVTLNYQVKRGAHRTDGADERVERRRALRPGGDIYYHVMQRHDHRARNPGD